jgi:hypothetical protein
MTEVETVAQQKIGVPKPVIIAMIVAISPPLLLSFIGVLVSLGHNAGGSPRNTLAFWMAFIQNGYALYACVLTLRGTKQYWLPTTASILSFISWFWLSFSSIPLALVFVGTMISIAIGIWSVTVLRKPEVRSLFVFQFDPVESVGQLVLPRLPKVKIDSTPGNISRASVLTLSSLCVIGILTGAILGNPADDWIKKLHEESVAKHAAEHAASVAALKNADKEWASGNKEVAVDAYQRLLNSDTNRDFWSENESDLSKAYCRVIDFQVEQGGPEAGHEMIRKAIRKHPKVVLSLDNRKANAIVVKERRAYDAEDERASRELSQERSPKGGLQSQVENAFSGKGTKKDFSDAGDGERQPEGVTEAGVNRVLSEMKARGLTPHERKALEKGMAEGMSEEEGLRAMAEGTAMKNAMDPQERAKVEKILREARELGITKQPDE